MINPRSWSIDKMERACESLGDIATQSNSLPESAAKENILNGVAAALHDMTKILSWMAGREDQWQITDRDAIMERGRAGALELFKHYDTLAVSGPRAKP